MAKKKQTGKTISPTAFLWIVFIGITVTSLAMAFSGDPIVLIIPIAIIAVMICRKKKEKEKAKQVQLNLLQQTETINDLYRVFASDPHGFESYIASLFSMLGYETEVTPGSNDGGKDIVMTKDGLKYVVEVKLYGNYDKIGREKIQKLHSAQIIEKADRAIFVTTSDYTAPAVEYAKTINMELIGSDKLTELIKTAKKLV